MREPFAASGIKVVFVIAGRLSLHRQKGSRSQRRRSGGVQRGLRLQLVEVKLNLLSPTGVFLQSKCGFKVLDRLGVDSLVFPAQTTVEEGDRILLMDVLQILSEEVDGAGVVQRALIGLGKFEVSGGQVKLQFGQIWVQRLGHLKLAAGFLRLMFDNGDLTALLADRGVIGRLLKLLLDAELHLEQLCRGDRLAAGSARRRSECDSGAAGDAKLREPVVVVGLRNQRSVGGLH